MYNSGLTTSSHYCTIECWLSKNCVIDLHFSEREGERMKERENTRSRNRIIERKREGGDFFLGHSGLTTSTYYSVVLFNADCSNCVTYF